MKKFLLPLLLVISCSQLISRLDDGYHETISVSEGHKEVALIFSHNINGETQPCGCRKFPLGGLEQVAGHFHQVSLKSPLIYIDTGDMLFPSPVLPSHVHSSMEFTANKLIEASEELGLKMFVPGDQDFALGIDWLAQVSRRVSFTFVLSNATSQNPLKSKPFVRITVGDKKFLFLGILDPELLNSQEASYFQSPQAALEATLKSAAPSTDEIVILLSHSGMEKDKRLAQLFPRFNWIIGAHSQAYTIRTVDEGATQIVQVLSRNHFLGYLQFPFGASTQAKFSLLETREEMAQVVKPNPLGQLMIDWKNGLAQVQIDEQKKSALSQPVDPLPTFNSCLECHKKQTDFWTTTSHAHAWNTLAAKKSDNDVSCVGCHSAGWLHPQGFSATPARVRINGQIADEANLAAYTKALTQNYHGVSSVRALASAQRKKLGAGQLKSIDLHGVSHDFGNVQCINCHDKKRDHPFDGSLASDYKDITTKCIQCHTPDQSPEWYKDNQPNQAVIQKNLKLVTCPKGKE